MDGGLDDDEASSDEELIFKESSNVSIAFE